MTPAIDRERGLLACAGSDDLHRTVLNMLAGDITARIAELAAAVGRGEAEAAGRLAHKHKGACLAVGAMALGEAFAAVDAACRAKDLATARDLADRLPAARDEFLAAASAL